MTTAQEIMMLMEAAQPHMDKIVAHMKNMHGDAIESGMVGTFGREVGAKRMRKVRRRGDVIRFSRYTETGKRRYKWLPSVRVQWSK